MLSTFHKHIFILITFVVLHICAVPAFAQVTDAPQTVTVDGQLFEAGSTTDALLDSSVVMRVQILNPAKSCILYEEQHTFSTLATNGHFNVQVGSALSDPKRTALDSANNMATVFFNRSTAITGKTSGGGGCAYTPATEDVRHFRFFVTPSTVGSTSQLSPDMRVDSVPQALVAQTLQGLGKDDVFKTSVTSTQAKLDNLLTTNYSNITDLIGGTSSMYLRNASTGTLLPTRPNDPSSPAAGQLWYDTTANQIKYYDGTAVQSVGAAGAGITSLTAGSGLDGGTITTTGTIAIATGGVTNAMLASGIDASKITAGTLPAGVVPTNTDTTKLPLAGGTMTGAITMGAATTFGGFDLLGTGHITMNSQKTITVGRYTGAQETTLISTLTGANAGATWYNSTTNKLMYWNGTSAFELAETTSAGGDITAVNTNAGSGLTGGATSGPITLAINVDNSTIEISTNTVQVKDAGIVSAKLATDSVTTAKIVDGNVTNVKIASMNITKLTAGAGDYFAYMPAGTECATGEVLKWNAVSDRWECGVDVGVSAHSALSGLTSGDDHTQYVMLAGRAGGQTIYGGTASGNHFTLESTSHATKGHVILQPTTGNVGIGTTNPQGVLQVESTAALAGLFVRNNPSNSPYNVAVFRNMNSAGAGASNAAAQIAFQVESTTEGDPLAVGAIRYLATTATQSTQVSDIQFINYNGDVNTPQIPLTIKASGSVGIGTTTPAARLDVEGTLQVGDGGETCTIAANAGMVKYAAGTLQYCNGSAWQTLGVSGSGLTTLNGQTGSTQTFAVNASGTAPAINSATDTHTLSIPLASGAGVTSGTISKTDYDSFVGKLSTVTGSTLNSARFWVGDAGNTAAAVLMSGDATLSNTGALTIAADAVTTGKIADGTITNADINAAAAIAWTKIDKTGAVASDVGAVPTARAISTNAGSGLTGGGDLTADRALALNVDNSTIEIATNTVQVKDGGITNAKINTMNITKLTAGAGDYFAYMPAGTECNTGEVLKWNAASDRWLCDTDATGSSDHGALGGLGDDDHTQYVLLAGRSGGQNLRGGTASGEDITIESTSHATKGDVVLQPTGGNVGIGTTTPLALLNPQGTTEQLRLSYDATNYLSFTVNSSGQATLSPTGTALTIDKETIMTAGFRSNSTSTGSNFWVPSNAGASSAVTAAQVQLKGSTDLQTRVYERGSSNVTLSDGAAYASHIIGQQAVTEGGNSNHPILSQFAVRPLSVTAGAATVTDTATLYLEDAASATVSGGNYALWVDSGTSRFDGNVGIGTAAPAYPLDVSGWARVTYLSVPGGWVSNAANWSHVNSNAVYVPNSAQGPTNNLIINNTDTTAGATTSLTLESAFIGALVTASGYSAPVVIGHQTGAGAYAERMRINGSGNVGIGTTAPTARLDVEGTIQIGDGGETCTIAANAGMVKYATGTLQYCNGSAWQTLGVSGSGLTTLNGETGSTQTFAVTATGTAPAINSATDTHTLSIPLASGAGVTSGTISKTDYDSFVAKLSAVTGSTLNSARIWVGDSGNQAAAVLMSGDAALSDTGVLTIASNAIGSAEITDGSIANADIATLNITKLTNGAGDYFAYMPAGTECNTGEVLKWNAASDRWLCDTDATGTSDHGTMGGLGDDDHTQYVLLAGRASGQNLRGGVASGEDLTIESTSHATKGDVIIQPSGGNVGIGTTAPNSKLNVYVSSVGGAAGTGEIIVQKSSGLNDTANINLISGVQGTSGLYFGHEGTHQGGGIYYDPFNLYLHLRSGGNSRVAISGSGNVGIGTSAPNISTLAAGYNVTTLLGRATTGTTGAGVLELASQLPDATGADTGQLRFVANSNSSAAKRTVAMVSAVTEGATANERGAALIFSVKENNAGGAAERLRIDNLGKFGIHNSSPTHYFDMLANTGASPSMRVRNTDGSDGRTTMRFENNVTSSKAYDIGIDSAGGGVINKNWEIRDATVGQTRLAVSTTGNVGIGTTSPTGVLHLKAGTATASTAPLKFTSGTVLSTPEAGAVEYDGTSLYYTDSGNVRRTLAVSGAVVGADAGSAAAPSLSFSGDTNTGFYSNGADIIGVSNGGTNTFNFSAAGMTSTTNGGVLLTTGAGSAGAPTYSFAGDPDTGWWQPGADTMAASTSGSERIRIDSSGNIGVGTSNPATLLNVYKTGGGAAAIRLDGEGQTEIRFFRSSADSQGGNFETHKSRGTLATPTIVTNGDNAGALRFNAYDGNSYETLAAIVGEVDGIPGDGDMPGAIKFHTALDGTAAMAERMRISNAGNVGIGTSNPASTLNTSVASGSNSIFVDAYGTGSVSQLSGRMARGTQASPTATQADDGIFFSGGRGYTGSAFATVSSAGMYAKAGQNFSAANQAGYLSFETTPLNATAAAGRTERVRIDISGNVGIGTTNPASKLDVVGEIAAGDGTAALPSFAFTSNTNTGVYKYGANTIGLSAGGAARATVSSTGLKTISGSAASPSYSFITDIDSGMFNATTDVVGFATAGVERMHIDASGNVGIGTTAADSLLKLRRDSASSLDVLTLHNDTPAATNQGPAMEFEGQNGSAQSGVTMGRIASIWDAANNNANMDFYTRDSGVVGLALRLRSDGRVNVGSNPAFPPASAKLNVFSTTTTGNTVVDGLSLVHTDSNSAGASGIGTRIRFYGESTVDQTYPELASIEAVLDDATDTSKDASLRFYTLGANSGAGTNSATERMRIDASGNVGIGTINPQDKLQIVDDANNPALRLTTGGGALNNGMGIYFERSRGTSSSPTVVQSGDNVGTMNYRVWDGSSLQPVAKIRAVVDGTPGAGDTPGRLEFLTTPDGAANSTERMVILQNGNVGIGTTVPDAPLHVASAVDTSLVAHGAMVLGTITSANMSLDNNEIQARNNGTSATLVLNGEGGTVEVGSANEPGLLVVKASTGTDATLRLENGGVSRGGIKYDNSGGQVTIRAYNGSMTDRIRMPDGGTNIQGDGTFQDSAFGPSEWVHGHAKQGDVVCFTGAVDDEDGEKRTHVQPCTAANSSNVIGVIIPDDEEPHHGNPSFRFQDEIRSKYKLVGNEFIDLYWRKNHVGLELTGFRPVNAVGPIAVGDTLVSSNVAGHAMATKTPGPSAVFGTAVEPLAAGQKGTVLARIHLRSGMPEAMYAFEKLASIPSEKELDTPFIKTFYSNIQKMVAGWLANAKNNIEKIYAKTINTDKLCVGNECLDQNTLKEINKKSNTKATPDVTAEKTIKKLNREIASLKKENKDKDQEIKNLNEQMNGIKSWICEKDPKSEVCGK